MAGENKQSGLSPPCKTLLQQSFGLGRQLGHYSRVRHFPCVCLSFPMLRERDTALCFHLPAASPGYRCHTCGPWPQPLCPRCSSPHCGPGQCEPVLCSLLTLIKILQHGGRKCILSSSAAAIRLPGNGWLAGSQGLQRAGACLAQSGGRR